MTVEEKREAVRRYGKSTRCDSCKLFPSWCANYNMRTCPESALDEALELIGYEQTDKEDNMSENKKPRLAEALGVEVGEKFGCLWVRRATFHVDKCGELCDEEGLPHPTVAVDMINHPEIVRRRPRWTEQEVKDAKAIRRILPEARDIERITETMTIVRDEDGFCLLTLQKDMFPNVKEGQTVKLADIIGGNT